MKHFANFIRLTDATINKARELVKAPPQTGWSGLSGFSPYNDAKRHDNLQHPLVTKALYKAATKENPNDYFRPNSLQQKEPDLMPLVQNRQLPKNKRDKINETVEKLVETSTLPYSYLKHNYDPEEILPIDTRATLPYIRHSFSDPQRLAGMQITHTLLKQNPNIDNDTFRKKYIGAMQEDTSLRKPIKVKLEAEKRKTAGDKLRAKLKDRQNYSDVFDTSKYETIDQYIDRNKLLDAYRNTGLMPR